MRYIFALISTVLVAAPAVAGQPTPGALNFQPPATRIMERIQGFADPLHVAMAGVALFVLGLLIWVIVRYNRRANPNPRKFSHNTLIEVIWTTVPVLILCAIAVPSFSNLFYQENEPDLVAIAQSGDLDNPDIFIEAAEKGWLTVKTQGNQWNWTYIYPDLLDDGGFPVEFVSNGLHKGGLSSDSPVSADMPRYLAVDYPMVIPANRYIRYQTAAADVIHAWTVPAFGVKTDAVPGRLNEGWFLVEEEGVYYGQCSELCGKDHAFMPIEVRVVSDAAFEEWTSIMLAGDWDAAADYIRSYQGGMRLAMAE